MIPEQPNSTSYRDRAAIYAWCASQVVSAEAKAALLYLEQMWNDIADVAEAIDENRWHFSLDREPRHLPPE